MLLLCSVFVVVVVCVVASSACLSLSLRRSTPCCDCGIERKAFDHEIYASIFSLRNCDPYCALSSKCFFKAGLHDLSRVCKAAKIRLVPHSRKMVSRISSFSSA